MDQVIYDAVNGVTQQKVLPPATEQLMPGISWGPAHAPFTPAYWSIQAWYANNRSESAYSDYRRGRCLREEVVACLLGGFGISSEMNEAAFDRLDTCGLLAGPTPDFADIHEALSQPLVIHGQVRRYRFPKQKANFIRQAMFRLDYESVPKNGGDMRRWLLTFSGVGPKTSSWITRNWLHSNEVAIIDIHVFRAGVIAGLFSGCEEVAKEYFQLEERFLRFADALGVEPRRLDVLIWRSMKDSGAYGLECFARHGLARKSILDKVGPNPV